MEIKGYVLENQEKLDRVILGKQDRSGQLVGGLGYYDEAGNAVNNDGTPVDGDLVLARYDREAGLITKDAIKVKTGAFWDFRRKEPRKEPDVMLLFPIGAGERVEVRDPKELGKALQTIEQAKAEKSAKFKAKKAKSKFKDVK